MKYLFLFFCLIACQETGDSQKEKQSPNLDATQSSILFVSYKTDENGEMSQGGDGFLLSHPSISSDFIVEEKSIDQGMLNYFQDAGLFFARMSHDMTMSSLDDSDLSSNCYYSVFDKEKKLFILDDEYHPMDVLHDLSHPFHINFVGLICLDSKQKVELIGRDETFTGDEIDASDLVSLFSDHADLNIAPRKAQPRDQRKVHVDSSAAGSQNRVDSQRQPDSEASGDLDPLKAHRDLGAIVKKINKDSTEQSLKNSSTPIFQSAWGSAKKFFKKVTRQERRVSSVEDINIIRNELGELSSLGTILNKPTGKFSNGASYKVGRILGEGGFGHVYEVIVTKGLKTQKYALKEFKRPVKDISSPIDRFQRLPFFMKDFGVSPDGRVQLLELGEHDMLPVFHSGALKGEKKQSRRARGDVFHDVFLGISAMHQRGYRSEKDGLVHWDLKPENILLGRDKRIKIIDLDDASAPYEGGLVGTPMYMPPERKRRNFTPGLSRDRVNEKSDIYSLGVMLGEAKYGEGSLDGIIRACCLLQANLKNLESKYMKNMSDFNNQKISIDEFRRVQENDMKIYNNEYIRVYNEVIQYYKTTTEISRQDRAELYLMVRMLHPNPELRPTIEEVRQGWSMIHAPAKRAMQDAKVLSDYFQAERNLAAFEQEQRISRQRENDLVTFTRDLNGVPAGFQVQ